MDELPKPEPTPLPESAQEFINPGADPDTIPPEERQMAMYVHLSTLSGLVTGGIGNIVGPLLIWQLKKDTMPSLEKVAKEAINFNITVLIAMVISGILAMFCVGVITALVVGIGWIVLTVMAGLKANEGIFYKYPATIRLVK
jgi:uncharacterized Tic20 family protein